VRNSTLAQLSRHYELPDRLLAAPSAIRSLRANDSVAADLFEAYIAGVFYSYLYPRPSASFVPSPPWTASEGRVVGENTPSSEQRTYSYGDAYNRLIAWLFPVMTPIALWIYEELKREQERVECRTVVDGEPSDDMLAEGALQRLMEYFTAEHGYIPSKEAEACDGGWKGIVIARTRDGSEV
jgi:ribonuclease-3